VEQSTVEKRKKFRGAVRQFADQKKRLGQDRVTGQEWRAEAPKLFHHPVVVGLLLDEKCNERAGVNNHPRLNHPNPPNVWDSWRDRMGQSNCR
jgi:hypothetical protein